MSVNKEKPHLYLILEDDANRQLAVGFLDHFAVDEGQVGRVLGRGWSSVLDIFESDYLKLLQGNPRAHVVMLVDFDGKIDDRTALFGKKILEDVRPRVFVIGSRDTPESLKRELRMSLRAIGRALADDCLKKNLELWNHAHLVHNIAEIERMVQAIKPFLFRMN